MTSPSEDHALSGGTRPARLAEVEGELAALDVASVAASVRPSAGARRTGRSQPAQSEHAPMPLWRRLGIVGACLLIAVGAVILVVHFVQARQPGQASSGSVTLSQAQLIEQQLGQANTLDQQGSTKAALELYDKVLSEDPSNPAALAYAGFLQWNVGRTAQVASLVRIGRAEIETAVKDSPTYFQGHLFYGLVLENQDHNDAAAVAQFNDFLDDAPPAAELPQAAPSSAVPIRRPGFHFLPSSAPARPRPPRRQLRSARRSPTTRGTPGRRRRSPRRSSSTRR